MLNVLLIAWLGAVPAAFQAEEPAERLPIEQVLTPRERSNLAQKTHYNDRIEVLRKAMERCSRRLERELENRNLAVIFRTLAEIRSISSVALDLSENESDEKERRNKEVKKLEIYLRKLSEQLSSQMLSVPIENRPQFEQTIKLAEELRDQLLQQLFGKALGALDFARLPESWGGLPARFAPHSLSSSSALQRGLWDLDKFTEKEYEKVQYAQELVKRVEVFLEIAKSRLDEIDRRREGREWDQEEPNPLEFFTYEDLLFGYFRAIEGIMTNIDEKARSRAVDEKDIRKSLKSLKGKIDDFIPRLQALEELVRSQKDMALYRRYRDAVESSERARKGALYGLGAPDQ